MQGHRAFGPRPAALHLTRMVRNKTSRRDRRIAVAAAFTPGYARRQVGAWFRNAVPGAPGGQGIPAAAESQSQAARRWALNQTVKNLIQKLGEAIHESVSESEHIAGVVKNIRDQGFDVMLMLEATIGLNQVEAESGEPLESSRRDQPGEFTTNDLSFLKSLRISLPDAPASSTSESEACSDSEDSEGQVNGLSLDPPANPPAGA